MPKSSTENFTPFAARRLILAANIVFVFQQHGFRQLDFQRLRSETAHIESVQHDVLEIAPLELHRRNIHGDGEVRQIQALNAPAFHAGLLDDPFADFHDHAGILGDRDEVVGTHRRLAFGKPAQQRFRAPDAAGVQLHLGLEIDLEFAPLDRRLELGRHADRGDRLAVHALVE
nr:hypothetical protein [Rhizobium sp. G21]